MSYLEAGGVRTWYAEYGAGSPLVLLHGAFTDASEFGVTTPALASRFRVLTPDRREHGHTADVPGPISYDLMAADTAAFLDQLGTGRSHLVGHSDGADVALLVAMARPDLVDRLVLISGNFHHGRPALRSRAFSLPPGRAQRRTRATLPAADYADGRRYGAFLSAPVGRGSQQRIQ